MNANRVALAAATLSAFALATSPALAQHLLPFPETDVGAFSGSAVVVKNTQNYLGSGHPRPFAILGVGIGTSAGGVYGWTTNTNGIGVYGLNTDTGFGGLFSLTGASPTAGSSALAAVNSGGSKSATDDYGTAGLFQITNAQNSAPALEATTAGPSEAGYFEINSIEGNDNSTARGIEPTPTNPNSAALVAINNNSGGFNCPSFAPGSGGCWGQAGYFSINNTSNQSDALFAQTATPHGTAVHGYVGPQFPTAEVSWTTAFGIYGEDLTFPSAKGQPYTGTAVMGYSGSGYAAYFTGGGSGGGYCYYDGGVTWSCVNPAYAMDERHMPNYAALLDKLDSMPMYYFAVKGAGHPSRNLGTSAEEFRAAFNLGDENPKTISDGNGYGVALAAAKGLYQRLKQDEATIATQAARIAALEKDLVAQEALLTSYAALADQVKQMRAAMDRPSSAALGTREARADPAR